MGQSLDVISLTEWEPFPFKDLFRKYRRLYRENKDVGRTPQMELVNGVLSDGGPLYRETNPAATIAEPFNAVTALPFFSSRSTGA